MKIKELNQIQESNSIDEIDEGLKDIATKFGKGIADRVTGRGPDREQRKSTKDREKRIDSTAKKAYHAWKDYEDHVAQSMAADDDRHDDFLNKGPEWQEYFRRWVAKNLLPDGQPIEAMSNARDIEAAVRKLSGGGAETFRQAEISQDQRDELARTRAEKGAAAPAAPAPEAPAAAPKPAAPAPAPAPTSGRFGDYRDVEDLAHDVGMEKITPAEAQEEYNRRQQSRFPEAPAPTEPAPEAEPEAPASRFPEPPKVDVPPDEPLPDEPILKDPNKSKDGLITRIKDNEQITDPATGKIRNKEVVILQFKHDYYTAMPNTDPTEWEYETKAGKKVAANRTTNILLNQAMDDFALNDDILSANEPTSEVPPAQTDMQKIQRYYAQVLAELVKAGKMTKDVQQKKWFGFLKGNRYHEGITADINAFSALGNDVPADIIQAVENERYKHDDEPQGERLEVGQTRNSLTPAQSAAEKEKTAQQLEKRRLEKLRHQAAMAKEREEQDAADIAAGLEPPSRGLKNVAGRLDKAKFEPVKEALRRRVRAGEITIAEARQLYAQAKRQMLSEGMDENMERDLFKTLVRAASLAEPVEGGAAAPAGSGSGPTGAPASSSGSTTRSSGRGGNLVQDLLQHQGISSSGGSTGGGHADYQGAVEEPDMLQGLSLDHMSNDERRDYILRGMPKYHTFADMGAFFRQAYGLQSTDIKSTGNKTVDTLLTKMGFSVQ